MLSQQIYFRSPCILVTVGAVVVGGVLAVVAAPAVLTVLGFTVAGVAVGSVAASAMAVYGGAIPAGGVLATLQSAGAAGLALSTKVILAAVGGGVGYVATSTTCNKPSKDGC